MFGETSARDLVLREVLHLTYTANDMAAFARELGYNGAPFAWDLPDRRHRRARLDAAFLHLYGVGRADAEYILNSFKQVREVEEAEHGSYRNKALVLAYMAALTAGDVNVVVAR